MSAEEVLDALLRLLGILISWPVIFLWVVILVRRELPALISKLAERITKAPGGFEFATLQQKVETLSTKVEQLERVTFEPSAALTPELQTQLQSSVDLFQGYFSKLGYQSETGKVVVFVDPKLKDNVYYDGTRIVLGEPLAKDTDAVFREYSHHALLAGGDWDNQTQEQQAVESGLADYFPCSFNNDPLFGEQSIHLFRKYPQFQGKAAIRNLDNNRTFSEVSTDPEIHNVGEIWGGAFWELRKQLGQATVDKLLFSTWASLRSSGKHGDFGIIFVRELLETAQTAGSGEHSRDIRAVFKRRGLKL